MVRGKVRLGILFDSVGAFGFENVLAVFRFILMSRGQQKHRAYAFVRDKFMRLQHSLYIYISLKPAGRHQAEKLSGVVRPQRSPTALG